MSIFDSIGKKLFSNTEGTPSPGPAPKLQHAQDQPQQDLELCAFVKNKIEEVRSQANRVSHEAVWMTNIAYLMGFDSVYYDTQTRQYRPIAQSGTGGGFPTRNRIRSNLILPGVQNRLARMLKSPPKYEVRPNSDEQEDKEGAQTGVELINCIWDKQTINRKRIDLGMWLQQCGHAYIKVSWDDQLGEPLVDTESNDVLGFEGDARIDVVSAFEAFPDPLAKTFDECGWFSQAKVRKLDYFRSHYPERGDLVKEEGAWLLSAQYEMRINSLNNAGSHSSGTQEQMKSAAIEISYYEKRSQKYPKGRHIITANGVLLKNDELPFGEIPFAKFDDVIIGGKYYSEAIVTHARPLQDQYNTALIKRAEWVKKLLAGKYIAARGHGLGPNALTDRSGEVVEYDPVPGATEPHALQLPVIPQYAYTETTDLESQLYKIMGLSEVSRGQLPSASIPAQGLEILLEQDETRIGIETEQQEHSWARVGQLILKCCSQGYVTERSIKSKTNTGYAVKKVGSESIKKNFDVTVIRGSTVPNSRTLKRNDIMNAFNNGLMGNPQDPTVREMVWGMMEFGDINKGWEDYRLDTQQIQKSIDAIEQAMGPEDAPIVDMKDNHPLHIVMKNRYRKSDKWQQLTPLQQELMQNDMSQHAKFGTMLTNPGLVTPPDPGPPPPDLETALKMNGASPEQNNMEGMPNADANVPNVASA